jgi:hypothetical protein
MTTIQGITDAAKQQIRLVLPAGGSAYLFLEYSQQQLCWFYSISWEGKAIGSMKLVPHPNALNQWRHVAGFGLLVLTEDNAEITQIEDFVNGTASLYLLDAEDVAEVASTILGNG